MKLIIAIFIYVAISTVKGDGVVVAKIDDSQPSAGVKINLDEEPAGVPKSSKQGGERQADHIGNSLVTLSFENCLTKECTLGNFVTDAMISAYTGLASAGSWSYASIAIVNPEIFNASIQAGEIYLTDLQNAVPVEYTVDVAEIKGVYLREMFEYNSTDENMIQVSGMKIEYNFENAEGSRIQSLKVRCQSCTTPKYEPLDDDLTYRLILPSHISNGEGEFSSLLSRLDNVQSGPTNEEVFIDYIVAQSPIFKEESGRITVYRRDSEGNEGGNGDGASSKFVPSVILLMVSLCMCAY